MGSGPRAADCLRLRAAQRKRGAEFRRRAAREAPARRGRGITVAAEHRRPARVPSPAAQPSRTRRSLSALEITVSDDTLMAALAIMGDSSSPSHG